MPALSRNKVGKVTKSKFKCPVATSSKIDGILANDGQEIKRNPELFIPLTNEKLDMVVDVIESQKYVEKKTLRKTPSISLTLSQSRSELDSQTLNDPKVKAAYFDFIEKLSTSSSKLTSTPQNSQRNTTSDYKTESRCSDFRDTNFDLSYVADFPTPPEDRKQFLKSKENNVNEDTTDSIIVAESQSAKIAVPAKARKLSKKKANKSVELLQSEVNDEVNDPKITIRKKKVCDNIFSKENFVLKKPAKKNVGKHEKLNKSNKPEKNLKGKHQKSSQMDNQKLQKNIKQNSIKKQPITLYDRMKALQACRNVGLYAVCDRCDKARYLPHIKDPLELPPTWFCHMNPDEEHNNCDVPEDVPAEEQDYLINNSFNSGSIVWARIDGYPYWPAMVEDDPDYEQYYWLEDSIEPSQYHVTFFDSDQVTRAWLHAVHIKPFKANLRMYRDQKIGTKYRARLNAAIRQAEEATNMSLIDRLDKYSFIERYPKGINDLMTDKGDLKRKNVKAGKTKNKQQPEGGKKRKLHRRTNSNASSTVSHLGKQIEDILGEMGNSDAEMSLDILQNLF